MKATERKRLKKLWLYEKQKGKCFYCGNPFTIHQLTFEHLTRKREGGTNHISNLALACIFCNQYREIEGASLKVRLRFIRRHTHYIHTSTRWRPKKEA